MLEGGGLGGLGDILRGSREEKEKQEIDGLLLVQKADCVPELLRFFPDGQFE